MAKFYPREIVEPSYNKEEPISQYDLIIALNWYNEHKNEKDAAKYLSCDVKHARQHLTYAWVTRMRSRGYVFSEHTELSIANIKSKFDEDVGTYVETVADVPSNVISIQDRVQAKIDQIIGEMEGLVDDHGLRGDASDLNAYQWMVDNEVKAMHAAKIAEFYQNRLSTLETSYKDPELKEYYSGFDKKKFLNLVKCYASIVSDAQKIANNAKLVRKPRKRKPVSSEKQVARLAYKEKDDSFKLQSIIASNIIGAAQLWVFNTKTRRLGVYIAKDRGGLGVKGSTLLNYVETDSIGKTLRKPQEILNSVLNGGKVTLRKLMDGINSKSAPMNGRINKDTILLRAVYDK